MHHKYSNYIDKVQKVLGQNTIKPQFLDLWFGMPLGDWFHVDVM